MFVPIDPWLYVSFAAGFVASRFLSLPARWLNEAMLATVLVLIGLLGLSLGRSPLDQLLAAIPVALLTTGIVLAVTIGTVWSLRPRGPPPVAGVHGRPERPWVGLVFLADVVAGFLLGRFVAVPLGGALEFSLYVLLALVGWGLVLSLTRLRRLWVPLTAAVAGAVAGAAFLLTFYTTAPVAFATTFGFGFYSLAGPLVASRAGATLGFLAFLTNFLRENLTMILSPSLGRRIRGEGLVAMGGATSMDTTLYFVTRFGDADAGTLALTSGFILTVAATVLLPLLLAIPGAWPLNPARRPAAAGS